MREMVHGTPFQEWIFYHLRTELHTQLLASADLDSFHRIMARLRFDDDNSAPLETTVRHARQLPV